MILYSHLLAPSERRFMKTSLRSNRSNAAIGSSNDAFTRIELVTVIAVVAVLVAIFLPALSEARPTDKAIVCLNNGRQLVLGWILYANDNHGGLVTPLNDGSAQTRNRPIYVNGDISDYANRGNTNISVITNGPLFTYTQRALDIYKCPSDDSANGQLSGLNHAGTPRVRSLSMNEAFGFGSWLPSTKYRLYSKTADVVNPSKTFVTVDEHPDSINDDSFAVQMVDQGVLTGSVVDAPSSLHNGAAAFTFADGHSEAHRWLSAKLKQPIHYLTGGAILNIPTSLQDESLQDAGWLSEHTTVLK